jgi:cohesin domain-containing protein
LRVLRLLPSHRRAYALACVLAAAAGIAALLANAGPPGADAQVPPTATPPPGVAVERIVPEVSQVSVNDPPFILGVTVEQVNNLGVYEVLLLYDPTLVQFTGAANGPFLGSSGRTVFCQPPLLTTNFAGTGLTRLAFPCNSSGVAPGPSGAGLLAQVQFAPVAEGVAVINLSPSLGDVFGNDIAAVATDGVVTIVSGPTSTATPTSTPCPGGVCPTNTPSATATATPVFLCPSPGTVLCFEPEEQAIGGVPTNVDVVVAGVDNLGGFEFTVQYEPAVVSFTNIVTGPFLGSSGRPVNCVAPQRIPPDKIRLSCVTLGVDPPGASGSGLLATLTFTPITSGEATLAFADSTLVAPDASSMPVDNSATGSILVDCGFSGCPTLTPTPTPSPSPTPTNTLSPTATFTPLSGGTPCGTCPPTFTPTATIPPGVTVVRVDPPMQDVLELSEFDSLVFIDNVIDLGSFDVRMSFDASKLEALSISPGPFLGTGGGSLSCQPTLESGSARLACVTLASFDGADGSGLLLSVRLRALAPVASTPLTLGPVALTDPSGDAIAVSSVMHGSVEVVPCGGVCPTFTPSPTPGTPTSTPTPDGLLTALLFSPGSQTVPFGNEFTVDVNVQNVSNLGAYQAELEYAPNRFEFVSVQHSSFLGSTGRTVSCQAPVVDVDDIVNPSLVVLRIACNTLGASPPGPNGHGLLVRVRFRNTGSGGTTIISFSDDSGISDPQGEDIPAAHLNSAFVTTGVPTATSTPPGGGGFAFAAPPGGGEAEGAGGRGTGASTPEASSVMLVVAASGATVWLYRRRGARTAMAAALVSVIIAASWSMAPTTVTASRDGAKDRSAPASVLVSVLAGDVNDDCRVDVRDEQLMANRYLVIAGSPLYEPRFDIEPGGGDGDIDGHDLQVVLSHDGLDCTTDTDGDGCTTAQELEADPKHGGGRDPQNPWDFYDVNASRKVDAVDTGAVRSRFNGSGPTPPQYVTFDRSPGAAPWAPGPPNNKINAVDISLVRAAFGHSCLP